MSYRDRNRKQITLPSGATTVVRKLTAMDTAVLRAKGIDLSKADGSTWTIIAITECCGLLVNDGESFRIVNKDWRDCAAGELALTELDQADALAIVDAVNALAGEGNTVAVNGHTFQAGEQKPSDKRAPDGEDLRPASIDPAPVAA